MDYSRTRQIWKARRFLSRQFCPANSAAVNFKIHKKDDVVFDPFVGSGTTAYEAESLGRHFVGIDIQPELIKHIKSKVDNKDYFAELITGDSTDKNTFSGAAEILHKRKEIMCN